MNRGAPPASERPGVTLPDGSDRSSTLHAGLPGLESLIRVAEEAGAPGVARDARALGERAREGRFFVACLGQFKRGKSTLVNALVGREVLPTGVAPVTSVVTVLRFGEPRARVRLGEDGWTDVPLEALSGYVSEAGNPENRKRVAGVEVFCPSPLLSHGLCLVDTPGIGSVHLGNTEETRAFVPHVDAAIVVLGADPPISADELELVEAMVGQVGDLLFVLNKADRVDESDRAEAIAFTRTVLREATGLTDPPVFELSARERLRGEGPKRDWAALLRRLHDIGETAGAGLVAQALDRGTAALTERLLRVLSERREALVRPVEASEARLRSLRGCARDAERAAHELSFLFDAELRGLGHRLDERATGFLDEAWPRVRAALHDDPGIGAVPRHALRPHTMDRAEEIVKPIVRAWMDQMEPWADHELMATTSRFTGHANAFVDALVASGQLPTDAVPVPVSAEVGLHARSHFYFYRLMRFTDYAWGGRFLDLLRTRRGAQAAANAVGLAYARRLLEANIGRVVVDLTERTRESRRQIEGALVRSLREIASTADQAMERARQVRDQGEQAVRRELALLDRWTAILDGSDG